MNDTAIYDLACSLWYAERSPMRRALGVEFGDIAPAEREQYMERAKEEQS